MAAIEKGFCQCGCGERTSLARYSSKRDGMVKGEPMRFVVGHARRGRFYPVQERFWAQVEKPEGDGCWLWTGHVNTHGYGNLRVSGKWALCHRLSFEWSNGPIPEGQSVLHRCDTPACVNPAHLFLGTTADNMADKTSKNRQAKGEAHGSAKLSVGDVLNIKQALADGDSVHDIAARFGVSRHAIDDIAKGRSWKGGVE